MEKIGGFLATIAGRMQLVSGSCGEHGEASVLVRTERPEWYCPACLEREKAEEVAGHLLRQQTEWLLQGAKIPAKFAGQAFIGRTADHKAVRIQVKAFRDFVVKQGGWASLVMIGVTGTGKSLLACELIESMIKALRISARYATASGMISEIQATYSREDRSQEEVVEKFSTYDILVVDEVDAIPQTANAMLLLNEIYNRRYCNGRPTVTISNQPFELLNTFVGDRIYSRLHENLFMCAHTWADERRAA